MLTLVSLFIVSIMLGLSILKNIMLTLKYNECVKRLLQLEIDSTTTNAFLLEKIAETKEFSSDKKQHEEGFLNFLNQSRDWAFEYIENVQQSLSKFMDEVDPHIEYFDTFGDVLSVERPDYVAMKQISKSYKELKQLLPAEEIK